MRHVQSIVALRRSNTVMSTTNDKTAKPVAAVKSKGQKRSQERGSATRSKKNPGKRPSQGGN
jgi:hypothetical protein